MTSIAKIPTLILSLAISLCLAEFVTRRWIARSWIPGDYRELIEVIAMLRPFEDVPAPRPRPAGEFSVVGIADSFGNVDALTGTNYHDYLRLMLASQVDGPTKLVNLSVIGYETGEEIAMLRDHGLRYRPRMVLHGFFVGNDTSIHPGPLKRLPGLWFAIEQPWHPARPGSWMLWNWLNDYRVARREIARNPKLEVALKLRSERFSSEWQDPWGPIPPPRTVERDSMSREAYEGVIEGYAPHFHRSYPESAQWKSVRANLLEMFRLSREAGAQHVLVISPDELQIDDEWQRWFFSKSGRVRSEYDLKLPQRLVAGLAREQGVPVIDLYPAFRAYGAQGGLYRLNNSHWNERGNYLAARMINQGMLEQGLVPGVKTLAFAHE